MQLFIVIASSIYNDDAQVVGVYASIDKAIENIHRIYPQATETQPIFNSAIKEYRMNNGGDALRIEEYTLDAGIINYN